MVPLRYWIADLLESYAGKQYIVRENVVKERSVTLVNSGVDGRNVRILSAVVFRVHKQFLYLLRGHHISCPGRVFVEQPLNVR